jgi:DNA-binding transcriptional regulator PaaX
MRLGNTTQKVLLLLMGGLALGLSGSPLRYKRVLRNISYEWRQIERRGLYRAIRRLYESKLIRREENEDGSISMVLTQAGREVALRYKLDEMQIAAPKQWDKRWRIIIFDIPEKQKQLRDALRLRLRQLGFIQLQKSVSVHPYECRNEIDFIIEFYNARRYVRYIEANHIDNELHLKRKFRLL